MSGDRPIPGILLMLLFCVAAPMTDAFAKILGASYGVVLLAAIRLCAQFLLTAPLALASRRRWRVGRRLLRLVVLRTMLQIAGLVLLFSAFLFLPLADAIAIAYVMPFILLLLARRFLGEEIGHRRLAACIAGFAGTLLVVQPSFAQVGWPALLPLGVAVIFAIYMLLTRRIAKAVDPLVLQAMTGGVAAVVLLPVAAVGLWLGLPGFAAVPLEPGLLALLTGFAVLGSAAHLLFALSLRLAPAATVAPVQYVEIPVAAVLGWMIFDDFPDRLALSGMALTIGAGLYVLARERAVSLGARPVPGQAPVEAER